MAQLQVPEWEISERFLRVGGPGGQNVNKVASAVQLRWNVERSSLPPPVKARFKRLYTQRISADGDILIEASEYRSQARNRQAARERLADMVAKAMHKPKPRIATRPGTGAVKRRIKAKKARGAVKALRGRVRSDDS